MKFLLTSQGITNASIENALVELLGKPIAESSALCIPTAVYAAGTRGASMSYQFISGSAPGPLCELGWKSLGVLELTALPSINEEDWSAMVRETDALLVWGGDSLYLCYWMRQSGLAELLPSLRETVYVGVSAGAMVMTPYFGKTNDDWFCREPLTDPASPQPAADDRALGLVDFSVFPHMDTLRSQQNSRASAAIWAARAPVPTYAIDDESAIKVVDGTIEVVSEGHWELFTPQHH